MHYRLRHFINLPAFQYHIDDDRCAEQRRNGVEGDYATVAGQDAEHVAQQGDDSAGQNCGWHENAVVVGRREQTRDMGNGKTDEGNGAAESGDDGRENACDNEQTVPDHADIDTEIFGITVAEQQGVERLDHQQCGDEAAENNGRKSGHLRHRDASEIAKSPDQIGLDALSRGKKVEKRDGRRRKIAYHNADDEQRRVVAHSGGKEEYDGHDGHGAGKSGDEDCGEARQRECPGRDAAAEKEYDKRHAKPRSAADTENRRVGQRIAEGSLEHQTAHGKRPAGQHCGDGLRQT